MKISYNWLKQYVDFTLTPEDVSEILTNTGLEVEEFETWESVKGGLKGVVIGEIKECVQHPDADKLKVTKVDIGTGELLQIVCGAPNCRVGLKSPIATIGANLYPVNAEEVFAIKKSKIRGVESFGMICAEDELGLGESHSGIMELPLDTPIGLSAAEYFNVESDIVYTIGLTPNRSDGFSHIGVARDLRAALRGVYNVGLDLKLPTPDVAQKFTSPIVVKIENTKACKRYSALFVKNVKVQESPLWLQNRLKAIGVKPIK
jgi:phenylalanyl-tRNA synthetase beta chain